MQLPFGVFVNIIYFSVYFIFIYANYYIYFEIMCVCVCLHLFELLKILVQPLKNWKENKIERVCVDSLMGFLNIILVKNNYSGKIWQN